MDSLSLKSVLSLAAVLVAGGVLIAGLAGSDIESGRLAASVRTADAASDDNVHGFAWSNAVGWIALNSVDYEAEVSHGVNVATEGGLLEGYAWSDNVGWISFDASDLSGCPQGPCEARFQIDPSTGEGRVEGWARTVSQGGPYATSSWISLHCSTSPSGCSAGGGTDYGVTIPADSCNWEGYAWSEGLGWISFSDTNYGVFGEAESLACTSPEAVPDEAVNVALNAEPNWDEVTLDVRPTDESNDFISGLDSSAFTTTLDGNAVSVAFSEFSGKYLATITGVADGDHSIEVSVTDTRGESGVDTTTFNINTSGSPQCDDGVDNDFDGETDYPEDDGCNSLTDNKEDDPVIPPSPGPGPGGGGGSPGGSDQGPTQGSGDSNTQGSASISGTFYSPQVVREGTESTQALLSWSYVWNSDGGFEPAENDRCVLSSRRGLDESASYTEVESFTTEENLPSGEKAFPLLLDDDGLPIATQFKMECFDEEGSDTAQTTGEGLVRVRYLQPNVNLAVPSGTRVSAPANGFVEFTLRWITENLSASVGDSCTASGAWSDGRTPNGGEETRVLCGADYAGGESCDGAGGGNYTYQMLCTRKITGDSDAARQTVSLTIPGFILSAELTGSGETTINSTAVCDAREPGGPPVAPIDDEITITPQPQDFFSADVSLSAGLIVDQDAGDAGWIEANDFTFSNTSFTCRRDVEDVDGDGNSEESFCGPLGVSASNLDPNFSMTLTPDVSINCNDEPGIARIRISGFPDDGSDTSYANIGINVQTFAPRFEEF